MRCLWFHIEYPFLRMSERWISKANHFLNGVDFCKQSLIFQFQLQKQGGKTADNSNTMKLWRTLIYEAPNLRESNGLFLYSQCHGSSLKDLECCVFPSAEIHQALSAHSLHSGSYSHLRIPLLCTCRPARLPAAVQPERKCTEHDQIQS